MVRKRSKRAKKCKECGIILRSQNKSGLCSHHYKMKRMVGVIKIRKANNLCIQCGKKVEPRIIYPAGKKSMPITKYPVRCLACQDKQGKALKRCLLNKNNKSLKIGEKIKEYAPNSRRKYFETYRKKRKANNLCTQCGKKVEPRIIYPAGKKSIPITKYYIRCLACQDQQKIWRKKFDLKTLTNNQNK